MKFPDKKAEFNISAAKQKSWTANAKVASIHNFTSSLVYDFQEWSDDH